MANPEVDELLELLEAWKTYIMENSDYLEDLMIQDPIVMARTILSWGDLFLVDEVLREISGRGLRERCSNED